MWVAVTLDDNGSTFSHRAEWLTTLGPVERVHMFNLLLDEAATCVRNGLAGTLPPQENPFHRPPAPLSEHEKFMEIRNIIENKSSGFIYGMEAIRAVLDR